MGQKTKNMEQDRFLMRKYSSGSETVEERFLGGVLDFFSRIKRPGVSLESALHEAAIYAEAFSQFERIAIWGKGKDGVYRYSAMIGFTKEAEAAGRGMAYSTKEMGDFMRFRPIKICRSAQFFLSDNKPYLPGGEKVFNRPNLLGLPRRNSNDMIEGDFIRIPIIGKEREPTAIIELSGPTDGKLPKRETILQLEFFASCLAPIIGAIASR